MVSLVPVPSNSEGSHRGQDLYQEIVEDYRVEGLSLVALAEWVTTEILELAYAASNPGAARYDRSVELLTELAREGFLVREAPGLSDSREPGSGHYRIVEPYNHLLCEEVISEWGSLNAAREQLLTVGLAHVTRSNIGQLALWARQLEGWDVLHLLWREYWAWLWSDSLTGLAQRAFANLPAAVLKERPELSYACVVFQAGMYRDAVTRHRLTQDGRLLYGAWRQMADAGAAVAGGTLSLGADISAGDYVQAREVIKEIDDRIRAVDRKGERLSLRTLADFNVFASTAMFLTGDISAALGRAETAITCSTERSYAAAEASAFRVLCFTLLGDHARAHEALQLFRQTNDAEFSCPEIITLPVRLSEGFLAAETLDRDRVLAIVAGLGGAVEHSELWFCYELLRAQAAILWGDPGQGLMNLDSAATAHKKHLEQDGFPAWVMARARAELLIAIGRTNHALEIITETRKKKAAALMLVPSARAHLAAGDGHKAVVVANSGIHSEPVTPNDRVRLAVLKVAGMLVSDVDEEEAAEAMQLACSVTTELGMLEAYPALPRDMRERYLAFHDNTCSQPDCILSNPQTRTRLKQTHNIPGNVTLIKLTRREQVLLPYLATSDTGVEIAAKLVVSINTLRKQIATLRCKLGAKNRAELINRAQELGLLPPTG